MRTFTDNSFFSLLCICLGINVICGYTHVLRQNNGWGSCPENCRCMPLNHRGVREILEDLESVPELGSKAEIESRDDGRTMICQGLRRLPNPVPYDIVTLTILGDSSIGMFNPRSSPDQQSDHQTLITNTQLRHIDRDSFRGSFRLNEVTLSGNNIGVLYPFSFHHLRRLRHLSLQNNNIRHLSAAVFRGLDHIEELTLSDNIIQYLPQSVFNSLPNLESLSLNGNKIRRLHANQFKSLVYLRRLNLSRNNITGFSREMFDRNSKLEELQLNGNRIWNVEPRWFRNLVSLRILSLRGNAITSISPNTFETLVNLQELLLSANHIDELQSGTFRNLRKLKILDLATNDIQEIQSDSFTDLNNLEELYLATNNLNYLQNGTFVKVPKVTRLDLSRNKIEIIEGGTLDPLSSIQYLDLSHNKLRQVRKGLIGSLSELKELNLDHNFISDIAKTAFATNHNKSSKLVFLSLQHNDIRQLGAESLSGIPKLKSINLGHNKLRRIHSMAFSSCENLQVLDLTRNKIKTLNNGVFRSLHRLIDLSLSNNKLRALSDSDFVGLNNLQQLNLESNGIFDISTNALKSLTNLVELNIAGNKLLNFNFTSIDNLQKLYALDISDNHLFWIDSQYNKKLKLSELMFSQNNLQTIRKDILKILKLSAMIDITGNPLTCDCQLAWMVDNSVARNIKIEGKSDLQCRSPRNLFGRQFSELTPDDLVCGYPVDVTLNNSFACSDVPNTKMSKYSARTGVKTLINRHVTIVNDHRHPQANGILLNENWALVPGHVIKDLQQSTRKELRVKFGRNKGTKEILSAIRHPLGSLGMQQYNVGLIRFSSDNHDTPTCIMAANQFDTISRITSRITVTTRIIKRRSKLKARYGKVQARCSNSNFLCVKVNGNRKHEMRLEGSPLYLGRANDIKLAGIGTRIRDPFNSNAYFIPLWTVIEWVNKVTAEFDHHCPINRLQGHCRGVSLPTATELLVAAKRNERH